MKVTRALQSEIRAAVKPHVRTRRPFSEVGYRGPNKDWNPNALLWTDDDDLQEKYALKDVKEFNDDPEHPGYALLDLYVYDGYNGDLETNVYVFIKDGQVLGATSEHRKFDQVRESLNFPQTRGW